MATRKDIILNRARKTAMKVTNIDNIFSRWCDYNDHRVIFDYRNEYSSNYKLTQMYNLDSMETGFDKLSDKNHHDPDYRLSQKATNRTVGRQLVNIGFDDPICTSDSVTSLNEIDLYCNEEISSSNGPEASSSDLPEDPFAESDDERDKDYIPDDVFESTISDVTVVMEDANLNNMNNTVTSILNASIFQHCEFDQCNLEAFSSCEKCSCLLCTEHFACQIQDIGCEKHYPYLTENTIRSVTEMIESKDKENDLNSTNQSTRKISNKEDKEMHVTSQCQYVNCVDEVFSTCGKCLCLLCFKHFIAEDTYNDCHNHNFNIDKIKRQKKVDQSKVLKENNDKQFNQEINTTDKGFTKDGQPRKRRKIEVPLSERKEKKNAAEVEKLTLKEPCATTCRRKCTKNISAQCRQEIHDEYVLLNWELKGCFIKSHVESKKVATRKNISNVEKPKRGVTYSYYFYQDQAKIEVCKTFFLTTLGYSAKNDKRLLLALRRPFEKQNCQRGKYIRKNKFDRDLIKKHITEIYNPVNSHYRREHAPNRLYLPSDITITVMHKNFCETYPELQVGFEVFRKVVRDDMNISFAHLGNEECELCAEFEQHHKNHETQNETCDFCKNFALHKSRYRESRKSYKDDVKKSEIKNDTIYFSVDLQKVVMLPRMDQFKRSIFCTRITAFNESYVPLGRSKKNNVPFAAVWHEATAGRKQEDIISALNAFLLHNRDVSHIVLWMDNCSAQNKNWAILSFLIYIINSSNIKAETITFKYLEPGHTFMSADSFHHQVEQAMQKKNKVYDFPDFVNSVREANSGKCLVKIMEFDDFYNYVDLSSQTKLRKMEPRVYLKDIMELQATRGDFTLRYKTSHYDNEMQILDFLQMKFMKTRTFPEFQRKSSPIGIASSIKQDIINKLLPLMPKNRQTFWLDLPITGYP